MPMIPGIFIRYFDADGFGCPVHLKTPEQVREIFEEEFKQYSEKKYTELVEYLKERIVEDEKYRNDVVRVHNN